MADTVKVDRQFHRHHLLKAEECDAEMRIAFGGQRHNAAVILAVHCCISAADALTIFAFGLRHAGESHGGVLGLLRQVGHPDMGKKMQQFQGVLSLKNSAEYRQALMSAGDAQKAVDQAGRFLAWVKGRIKGE